MAIFLYKKWRENAKKIIIYKVLQTVHGGMGTCVEWKAGQRAPLMLFDSDKQPWSRPCWPQMHENHASCVLALLHILHVRPLALGRCLCKGWERNILRCGLTLSLHIPVIQSKASNTTSNGHKLRKDFAFSITRLMQFSSYLFSWSSL